MILHIWFLTSFILALRAVAVTKLVISGILSSTFFILALHTSFVTTSFFTTSREHILIQEKVNQPF